MELNSRKFFYLKISSCPLFNSMSNIIVKGSTVTVKEEDLDAITAVELLERLTKLKKKKATKVVVNLSEVETIGTVGVQVLISAAKSFKGFSVDPDMKNSLHNDLLLLSVDVGL